MRIAASPLLAWLLLTGSCGYVGPVLPPSPNIPLAINNLTVVEQGNAVIITCSTPLHTTDSIVIKRYSQIDLAIGPEVRPDLEAWSRAARHYELTSPPPPEKDDPQPAAIVHRIPVGDLSPWMGKKISVAIRTAAKDERFSSWSNFVTLEIVQPLSSPVPVAAATAEGIELSWSEQRPGLHYAIFRKGPSDKEPQPAGTSETPQFVDVKSQFLTPYTYTVVAQDRGAESLPGTAQPNPIVAEDKFPPRVPGSLTALAAANSIELTWERSPDADLKGYYVFRSANGAAFERVGDIVAVPSFSDHNVEHGKTYRYSVSAVDQMNNESQRSAVSGQIAF